MFGLVPTNRDEKTTEAFHKDQDRICEYLTELVDDFQPPEDDILKDIPIKYKDVIPPKDKLQRPPVTPLAGTGAKPDRIARVDLYQKLLNMYEVERFRWAAFKRNARPKEYATEPAEEIDDFNRVSPP